MRLISCSQIADGVELARDVVVGPPGTAPLLRAGVKLSARYRTALPKAGVGSVWIEDALSEGIVVADPLRPETRERVHRATGEALFAAGRALHQGAGMPPAVLRSLTGVAEGMVADLLACPDAAVALDDLSAFDSYTHRHSVQVTVLGLLIARRMWERDGWTDYRGKVRRDRVEDRLRKLGLGLLVHDVGKLAVPPEVLNKPGRLTDDEFAVIKTHPRRGADLLAHLGGFERELPIVLWHHERFGGGGYPDGVAGQAIPLEARIMTVCDVYDALISRRAYREPWSHERAMAQIVSETGATFDPACVDALAAVLEGTGEQTVHVLHQSLGTIRAAANGAG